LLEEALGGPWAAWDVAAPFAIIAHHPVDLEGGRKGEEYKVSKSDRRNRKAVKIPPGVRHWRSSTSVLELTGNITLDRTTSALWKADLVTVFAAQRSPEGGGSGQGEPVVGTVDVQAQIDQVGKVPPIARPAAEELSLRQRIVPEQKELLGGLGAGGPIGPLRDGKAP
jgi:hypothetical protein